MITPPPRCPHNVLARTVKEVDGWIHVLAPLECKPCQLAFWSGLSYKPGGPDAKPHAKPKASLLGKCPRGRCIIIVEVAEGHGGPCLVNEFRLEDYHAVRYTTGAWHSPSYIGTGGEYARTPCGRTGHIIEKTENPDDVTCKTCLRLRT